MRRLCLSLLLAFISLSYAQAQTNDEALREALIGIWSNQFDWVGERNEQADSWTGAYGEDHYSADGKVSGFVEYTYPDRKEKLLYAGRWSVKDSHLIVVVIEASGSFLRPGTKTKDRILALDAMTLTLQLADGNQMTLQRK